MDGSKDSGVEHVDAKPTTSSKDAVTSGDSEDIQKVPEIAHNENASVNVQDAKPSPSFTIEEENRVYRKLDWHLMPLLFVLYSLSVLDRANLGNARIAGMEDDIDLSGRRYDWLATAFYIACKPHNISF